MNRTGLAALTAAFVAIPLVAAACGGGDDEAAPLPPIVTTTTTTTLATTTTSYVPVVYEVQQGDNLGNIARNFEVSLDELMAINSIPNPDDIQAGQRLLIPPPTLLVVTLPPSPTTVVPTIVVPTDLAPTTTTG